MPDNPVNQAIASETILLEEFDLGSARGGLAGINKQPLEVRVTRSLDPSDLPAILNPPPVSAPGQTVSRIRASHHKLAQLIAEGAPGTEISLVTGYSQSYISTLQGDPAFEELVAYYSAQQREIFIDAQERLRSLGLDAIEKLHEHLHDPAKVWSHRELMEVIKTTMPAETSPKTAQGTSVSVDASGGGSLEIKFVGAAAPAASSTIESQFKDITPS